MRHIIGNDATRRGMLDVFDLFQHKPLNKRLFHIVLENLLANFFLTKSSFDFALSSPLMFKSNLSFNYSPYIGLQIQQPNGMQSLQNPLIQLVRLHYSMSPRVKPDWKANKSREAANQSGAVNVSISSGGSSSSSSLSSSQNSKPNFVEGSNGEGSSSNANSIHRSKSFFSEIQC